jgi:hypothetical protein
MDSPFVTMHQDDLLVFGPMLQKLLNIKKNCPIFFQINTIFFKKLRWAPNIVQKPAIKWDSWKWFCTF